MKKIILISLLSCVNLYSNSSKQMITKHKYSMQINSQEIVYFLKEYSGYIATIPILFYHHKNIINTMINRPYISSFFFYFILNYACDSCLHYQKQQEIYKLIHKLKKLCLYLVITHGIKNYIDQDNTCLDLDTNKEKFINTITENVAHSLDEITSISLKFYQEFKIYLQSLNIHLHIESEEFAFLCYGPFIDMQTITYLSENNTELHEIIDEFKKNPATNILRLRDYLKLEITAYFIDFEKHLLKSNIRSPIKL